MKERRYPHDDCGCGCGCGCEEHDHEEMDFIDIEFEDGASSRCQIIDIFEVDDKSYIAVLPEGDENVLIYGFEDTEDGPELQNIEDEDLYDKVCDVFVNLYDEDYEDEEEDEE